MWRFHSHRGVPTRPTVINAASQALYGVIQPLSSSVSGILNVGRTQAPISPPSRAHRRGCPMLCFHSDRGVQTSLSVDTVASQALCGTIQPRPSSGSGILSVGRHARPISPPTSPHRRGCPLLADSPPWRRENGPHCRYYVDTAAFQTLCEPKRAVSSSRSGVLSVGGAHGRFYRPREPHRRGCRMWRFHSHRGVPTPPAVDTAAFYTLRGPNRAVSSSGSGILTVGRAYVRLYRPREPH